MIPIIPQPVTAEIKEGKLSLEGGVKLTQSGMSSRLSQHFQDVIKNEYQLPITENAHEIKIRIDESNVNLSKEGYKLTINETGILIQSMTEQGAYYGFQSLLQLLHQRGQENSLSYFEIEDYPRFSYRGLMFDTARHYHPVDTIKKVLDIMALLKMNVFHWHITEDQGWRIEIKKYPRLTEVGSKRTDSKIGGFTSKKFRGQPHSGFYSQLEIKEVVKYAADRFITIIPEIELPGHSCAAIASYPHLGCTGDQIEVKTSGGIFSDIYCAGKESTFEFLEDVLDEVLELFPSELIHIGGDEAPKKRWKACPECQKRIRTENLKDEHDLQVYFTNRIGEYLKSKNRRLMGWNEILGDTLDPSAVAQWWVRGKKKVLNHLRNGREFVMSKVDHTYLDYNYLMFPMRVFYNWDPVPKQLESKFHSNVLGVEAPIWTEWVPNLERLGWQVFPRLMATAEVGWTPVDRKDYSNFKHTLEEFVTFLDENGLPYAPLEEVDPKNFYRFLHLRKWMKWPEV